MWKKLFTQTIELKIGHFSDIYAMNFVSLLKLKNLIRFVMSIVFIAHVGYIGYELLYPKFPEIVNYKKQLSEIDFPVVFKVCANEANISAANEKITEIGYTDLWKLFLGESMYNDSIYGWAGHTENGSTTGSVEGGSYNLTLVLTVKLISDILQHISYNWSQIVTEIWVYGSDLESEQYLLDGKNIRWSHIPLFPNCQLIDLMEYFDLKTITLVQLFIGEVNLEILVYMEDRRKVVGRTLESNMLAYDGPVLKIVNAADGEEIRASDGVSSQKYKRSDQACRIGL